MIGVSAGTASVLGLNRARCDVLPSTAYLMLGQGCSMSCTFCAQSRQSSARSYFLSRVAWPPVPEGELFPRLKAAYADGSIERACFQIVNSPGIMERMMKSFQDLRQTTDIPVAISCNCLDHVAIDRLFGLGVASVAIPLDTATPGLYRKIKGGSWKRCMELLIRAARNYPGKVATHLIAGLGETEEEMVMALEDLYSLGVRTGLFAFTPVPGTALEKREPPSLSSYRRIQVAHYLIKSGADRKYEFKEGKVRFRENSTDLRSFIGGGEPFETSGCPGCNRPYYNEKPGKVPYNFPRKLSEPEIQEAYGMLER